MSETPEAIESLPPDRCAPRVFWLSFSACTLLAAWAAPALRARAWHVDPENGVVLRWLILCLEHPARSMTGIALLALALSRRPRARLTQAERSAPGSRGNPHI